MSTQQTIIALMSMDKPERKPTAHSKYKVGYCDCCGAWKQLRKNEGRTCMKCAGGYRVVRRNLVSLEVLRRG